MKDHKQPETAPSIDDSVYDSKTHSDWERSHTDGPKVSYLSVKSNRSRGEPPIFSADPPDTDRDNQNDSRYDLHWQKKVEQKPNHLPKDCLFEQAGLLQFQKQWKTSLKQRFEPLLQGTQNSSVSVTEGLSSELHQEDSLSSVKISEDSPSSVKISELHQPLSSVKISELLSPGSARTLLTVGSAGVGKTVLVQKVMVDWCEDKALQHIQLMFPLPVAQLKLLQQRSWTLLELLQTFCPGLRESGLRELAQYRVLFILDALDQCRLDLDFSSQPRCCDPEAAMPVNALLTNLMLGNLLPEAQVWIICRPGAARSIPPAVIDRVSQVIGFSRRQQQLYLLQNRQELQEELQQELQAEVSAPSEALHSLHRLPLFCSLSVSHSRSLSLTQQLLHFLSHHMKLMKQSYGLQSSRVSAVVKALCGLALQQLQSGELTFSEEQLSACGLGVTEAVVYSGLCCQVFTEDLCGGHWTFSFVHPCLQEFLSALFIHMDSSTDRQKLHRAVKDHPRVQHFLQELDIDKDLHGAVKDRSMFLHPLQELDMDNDLHGAVRDRSMFLHPLQEPDMDSSVSERGCSSETLTDSAQMCEAAPVSDGEEPTVSASEGPTEQNQASKTLKESSHKQEQGVFVPVPSPGKWRGSNNEELLELILWSFQWDNAKAERLCAEVFCTHKYLNNRIYCLCVLVIFFPFTSKSTQKILKPFVVFMKRTDFGQILKDT